MVRTHAPGAKVLTSAQLKTSNPLLTLGLNLLQDTPSLGLQGHSLLLGSVTLQQNFQLPNADLGPTTPPDEPDPPPQEGKALLNDDLLRFTKESPPKSSSSGENDAGAKAMTFDTSLLTKLPDFSEKERETLTS